MAEPPRKRARVSKNKKKSWRKHTDIQDVEDYLEETRIQERTGGIAAEKPDDQLFFVDTVSGETDEKQSDSTSSARSRKKAKRPLKCHALLEPDPNINPARIQTNFRKSLRNKHKLINKLKEEHASKSSVKQNATKQRKQARKVLVSKIKAKGKIPVTSYDLWGQDKEKEVIKEINRLKQNRQAPLKPVRRLKPSEIPSIEVPHPGASYNPAFEDHQELLVKAVNVELVKEKEEKRIKNALDAKFPNKADAPTEGTWIKEMSAGLFDESDEEESDDVVEDDEENVAGKAAVRREDKKTKTQRNKEKKRKEEELMKKQRKEENVKKSEIYRLRSIKADLRTREEKIQEKAEKKAEMIEANKNNPKKLGKLNYEPADIEIKTTDELVGSLRLLKPEGNLLADRFNSLQKRNVIETRVRASVKRKYKPKAFDKKSHREVTL